MNEKDEVNLFPLPLPGMSYMMATHVLTGYVGEHHLNPKLHQSHNMGCSDTGHQVTLVKADEGQHRSHRKTLEILPLPDLLLLLLPLPLPCHGSAMPWGTREVPTLL